MRTARKGPQLLSPVNTLLNPAAMVTAAAAAAATTTIKEGKGR